MQEEKIHGRRDRVWEEAARVGEKRMYEREGQSMWERSMQGRKQGRMCGKECV